VFPLLAFLSACFLVWLANDKGRSGQIELLSLLMKGERTREKDHLPVAGGGDKVEKGVDTVVAEARVTLDPGLF